MKQAYKDINFRADRLALIAYIDSMCRDYQSQGFMLSVRQLYYQLVARGKIPNTERSYQNTASLINDGRLAGMLDWDAIEDRGRDIVLRTRWESGSHIVRAAANSFHQDKWTTQEGRVIVIVEKAALAGVLEKVCAQYDVPLLAARGYPSVSIVREMVIEHVHPAIEAQQNVTILHLGDHDPSGIDMTRDLSERIDLFVDGLDGVYGQSVMVNRIALTMEQVDEVQPPPNPAKVTDSRFVGYQAQFGDESWELDALEPRYLVKLVTQKINEQIDMSEWEARVAEIESIRDKLTETADQFDEQGI